jgi:hypothetical protein
MAAKAEVLTGTTASTTTRTTRSTRPSIVRLAATAVREWGRRGQLGSSATAEMGRHTGGRC